MVVGLVDFAGGSPGLCGMGLHHQSGLEFPVLRHTGLRRACAFPRRVMGPDMKRSLRISRLGLRAALVPLLGVLAPVPAAATPAQYLEATLIMEPPRAAQELCTRYDWACAGQGAGAAPTPEAELALIEAVNRQVNMSVRAVPDRRQYGAVDYWSLPTELGGDCEDFALLKKKELIRLGLDPKTLLLATVLDRKRTPHAVLIYRSPQGDFLLDNLTDEVIDWRKSRYIFLRMQNPDDPRLWVGGFRPN